MKRSKFYSFLVGCLFAVIYVNAQSIPVVSKATKALPRVDFGIKIGANFAQLGGDNWEQTYQPGIMGGAFVGLRKHKIGVQVEALLNTSHYTTKNLIDSVNKGDFRATYFDIPILFEYRLISGKLLPKVWIMAGPQFSSLMSVKSLNDYAGDANSSFKSGNFSGVLGLEVRYLKFTLGGRYILGLTNIHNENTTTVKQSWNSRSGQLYLGFRFI